MSDASEAPELPDSDDPWELLGVPRDVDKKGLRKAYAKAIRIWRPDRAPEAFRRIQAAYEDLRERLDRPPGFPGDIEELIDTLRKAAEAAEQPEEPEGEDSEADSADDDGDGSPRFEPGGPALHPPLDLSEVPALPLVEKPAELAEIIETVLETEPGNLVALRHRFLLEESGGGGFEAHAARLEGMLEQGVEAAEWIRHVLSDRELAWLALRPCGRWSVLGAQPPSERIAAVEIFAVRCEELAFAGRWDELFAEWREPELLRAAQRDPQLGTLALRVAAAAAWSRPEESRRLFEQFREDDELGAAFEGLCIERLALVPEVELWRREARPPAALVDVLNFAPCVRESIGYRLARRLGALTRERPLEVFEAFRAMEDRDPELIFYAIGVLEPAGLVEPDVFVTDDVIAELLQDIDQALGADPMNALTSGIGGTLAIAMPFAFYFYGVWGIIISALAAVVWVTLSVRFGDRVLYRKIVRPRLAEACGRLAIGPERVLDILAEITRAADDIGRFTDEIREDLVLALQVGCSRLAALHIDDD